MNISMRFDLRGPELGATHDALYEACIDQVDWADKLGFSTVYLCEHHAAEDGYCPSPLVLGGAIAARTKRIEIHFSALVVTMHNPLRLAEDLAILDLMSRGRITVTAGVGYRPHEYEMFDVDPSKRVEILNETIDVFEHAWRGEPFAYRNKMVRVTPKPWSESGPKIILGGSTHSSARRAARKGYPFFPGHPDFYVTYQAELEKLGRPPAPPLATRGPNFLYITRDPESAWQQVGPHVKYATNSYAEWALERGSGATTYKPVETIEELKAMPIFQVLTPEQCVAYAQNLGSDGELCFNPLMGGLDPALSWESLYLFEQEVLPELVDKGLIKKPE
jgi:alkanesulfonate monooxygenase SsuD/methylene tetrahydromethanopterin reductase-like flavin-dependent oxidoreductase (luciferase family)